VSLRRAAARTLLAAGALVLALGAHAERADRDKEANVTADHSTLDDLHQVEVLTGHVLLIKGTMRLTGDRMEHRQDDHGYQYYVVTAAPNELATFHERRDPVREGVESTLDGYAERIEYNDRTDEVTLYRRALVKRFENDELRDELSGARILYDGRKATYDVDGRGVDGSGSRVHIRMAPRSASTPPLAPAPAAAGPGAAPAAGAPPAPADKPAGAPTGAAPPPAAPLQLQSDRQLPDVAP
jgi:lipopolysaccharide export system protein LptA